MNLFLKFKSYFLTKSRFDNLKEFYELPDLQKAHWISIAINKNMIQESFLTKEIDLLCENRVFSIKSAEKNHIFTNVIWENSKLMHSEIINLGHPALNAFNNIYKFLIEKELTIFKENLRQENADSNLSKTEIIDSEKALEWIKVSFAILEKAIIESLTNAEMLFQLMMFFGKNPKGDLHQFRIIVFNLDIEITLTPQNSLSILIFNDKNLGYGATKSPSLRGEFRHRKKEIFDEIIKLLSVLSPGIINL